MGLKAPTFSPTEFMCVRSAAALVRFYNRVQTIERRRKTHENAASVLTHKLRGLDDAIRVRSRFAAMLDEACSGSTLTENERRERLSVLMPELNKATQYPLDTKALTTALMQLYCRCDVTAFQRDCLEMPDATGVDGAALVADLENEKRLVERAEKDLADAWEDAAGLFSEIPLILPDDAPRQVQPDEHEKLRRRNAERLVRRFVQTWRERAPLFNQPVTIAGIAIDSLPAAQKADWQEAYDSLQLSKLPGRPYFSPIRYQMSQAERDAEATYQPPGKGIFSKLFA